MKKIKINIFEKIKKINLRKFIKLILKKVNKIFLFWKKYYCEWNNIYKLILVIKFYKENIKENIFEKIKK